METPKTYSGYDEEGNFVLTVTAVDANGFINPSEVQTAIENVKTVVKEQMTTVTNAIRNFENDAKEAIIVQGTNMSGVIEDICTSLKQLDGTIGDSISCLYDEAVKVHDAIQTKANSEAYSQCSSQSGVVSVR